MTSTNRTAFTRVMRTALLATTLLVATPALAQLTTSTIRGTVSTGETATPGAVVTAVNVETNAITRATAGPDGNYVLTGLRPGTYDISVGAEGAAAASKQRVIIGVGETATLDVDVAAPAAAEPGVAADAAAGDIVVLGRRLVETKTSEVATNISREQIENLPQNNRNFLNFAALAPGIKVNQSEFRQTFSGAGVGSGREGESTGGPQVNVFIDGVSLKSNVNQGGIVGQDVSRGNPFSQLAVSEFRVLTSNFKAEYEDAGTAIITAVTKSGSNEFHGEVFGTYQDEKMIARDALMADDIDEPPLERLQYGGALGGPIIKDKLFFFANYEANFQDRARTIVPGGTPELQATLPFDVNDYRGSFASPFREHLGFAKVNWEINPNQTLEVTASIRKETDIRDFGDRDVRERGTSVKNDVYTGRARHLWNGDGFVNEFTVDYLKSELAFGSDLSAGFGLIYDGVINIGGRGGYQEVEQKGITFRDNFSLTDIHWNGDHLIKLGGKLSFQKFRVGGTGNNVNPQFLFRNVPVLGLDFSFPDKVNFGGGDAEYGQSTTQFGLFVQDDWAVNSHLTLNLGLRWDVDTKGRNPDFVTPDRAVEALRDLEANPLAEGVFWDVDDYISTGDNRKVDYNNIAPRIGFSYDLNADQRTVIFGGYGRYYDRTLYRNAAEETQLSRFRQGELFFSLDGLPRDGHPTVVFQDEYLTEAGFQALLDGLAADPTSPGTTELRAIPNDLETPYTDQFSIGVRQRFGAVRMSVTYNYTIGKDQLGYLRLNRTVPDVNGNTNHIPLINGYGNLIAGVNFRKSKYHGLFVTVDKPYSKSSGYGFGLAYTLAYSKQRGYEFEFDRTEPEFIDFFPNAGDERHRLVANGIVDLPLGLKLSGLATIGSGVPQLIIDGVTDGFQNNIRKGNTGRDRMFAQLDLRLLKSFNLNGKEFQVWAEVFNVLNRDNLGYNDACCGPTATDPASVLIGPPRSFQVGTAFRF